MLRGRVKSARPRRACAGVDARGRTMVIRFFASVRNITGVKEVEWDEPTPTLGELLRLLSDRYGAEFRRWVLDGEDLGGSVMVVVNGDDARHQAGLSTPLLPEDVVSILPIMAGGSGVCRGGDHGAV
jgi:MoaD family protein